ncbi:hypothetical protein [Anaerotignum sp.]|nr:hypothetical protein [Anaerotignum sp.]
MESIYAILFLIPTFIVYGLGIVLAILAIKCMLKYLKEDKNQ